MMTLTLTLRSRTKQWTMMSRVFTKDQERSRPKHCPLAGEDEEVVVDDEEQNFSPSRGRSRGKF